MQAPQERSDFLRDPLAVRRANDRIVARDEKRVEPRPPAPVESARCELREMEDPERWDGMS